jgi:hypothetical protein
MSCNCIDCRRVRHSNGVHFAKWASDCDAQFACDLSWNAHMNESTSDDSEVMMTEEGKKYTLDKQKVTCKKCKEKTA